MGKTLTGAEREQKAAERLAEKRAELASLQGRMAQSQSALDSLAAMERTAQAQVSAAEKTVEAAAQRVDDAHAAALVGDGDAELMAAHGAAVDARKAARAALDEARAALEQVRAKVAAESAPIRSQIAEDDDTRGDVQRLISSLERAQERAHGDAGKERLQAAHSRYSALQQRIAEHQQAAADLQADLDAHHSEMHAILAEHPELKDTKEHAAASDDRRIVREVAGAYLRYLDQLTRWHTHPHGKAQRFNAVILSQLLSNPHLAQYNTLQQILEQRSVGMNGSVIGLVTAAQRQIRDALESIDAQRARELDKLPSVAAQAE